jgi:acetyltransferase-like isoleucine patch superfamily enzyme
LEEKILQNESNDHLLKKIAEIDISLYPVTTNTFSWTSIAIFIYLVLHVLSFLLPSVMILTFFTFAMDSFMFHWRIYLIFIDVLAWWGSYLLISLLLGKLFLIILKLIHKPREGLFEATTHNKDYYYYCLRVVIKKFIFWIWNNFCFPWASNLAFKLCDIKADFKSTFFDGWCDLEFVEFGNNMMVGQGAVVLSSIIIRIDNTDYLLLKKVIIGDHVVLGGHSIVAPGTVIGKGTTLGIWAVTQIGQILEPNYIYIGRPAKKYQPTITAREESKSVFYRRIVDTGEKIPFDIYCGTMETKE